MTLIRHKQEKNFSANNNHGYSPQYDSEPFTDFESINPETDLSALNLNWRESDLPERIRTKHVHRLHPYLGKFIPQLVEIFLRKYRPGKVCDPFSGSGTTLVEAASLGIDSVGCDISSFNNLMSKVKTDHYDLELLEAEVHDALNQALEQPTFALREGNRPYHPSKYLLEWFAPSALRSLLAYQALLPNYSCSNVLKVILSRAARSARQTTHFDLDFPKRPQTEPYQCYKHGRICKPTDDAARFLTRYSHDTLKRIREFSTARRNVEVSILTGDTREVEFPPHDLVITSPPYVGLIDYHEQHRYAYELLGLEWRADDEIGSASRGNSGRAQTAYVDSMTESFVNVKKSLSPNGRMVVIVNDKLGLYDEIRERSGFHLETRLERHVNRRTGRRSGDFYESIFVWERKE